MRATSLIPFTLAFAPGTNAGAADNPAPTQAPFLADLVARATSRATTSYYSMVSTAIPRDDHSIGMGLQREGTDEYYWVYCIDNPFTTLSGFAGCGTDDLYTACSGQVATGIDGDEIRCDQQCVTHKVYEDLDATTFTPLIGCGKGTSTMNLLRTSTRSDGSQTSDSETTTLGTATDSLSTSEATDDEGSDDDSSALRLTLGAPFWMLLVSSFLLL